MSQTSTPTPFDAERSLVSDLTPCARGTVPPTQELREELTCGALRKPARRPCPRREGAAGGCATWPSSGRKENGAAR